MNATLAFAVALGVLAALALRDRLQKKHAVISNFPIIGHFRHWLEALRGPLRQYIVTGNDEERPFSRDQRRWVARPGRPIRFARRLLDPVGA